MIENDIPWLILDTPQKQRHHRWIQVRLSIKMQQSNMAKKSPISTRENYV